MVVFIVYLKASPHKAISSCEWALSQAVSSSVREFGFRWRDPGILGARQAKTNNLAERWKGVITYRMCLVDGIGVGLKGGVL